MAEKILNKGSAHTEAEPLNVQTAERSGNSGKRKYFISVVGSTLDLAYLLNLLYLCSRYGGGTFLIPYCILLFVLGIQQILMKLTLGQHDRRGAINCWGNFVPLFRGIVYADCLIEFYINCSNIVLISWNIRFFFASFIKFDVSTILPKLENETLKNYTTSNASSILEIHESDGIDDLEFIEGKNVFCLATVILLGYFAMSQKIRTSGKVVWFTAILLFFGMLTLLVRGITLPGSFNGIQYLLRIDYNIIVNEPEVWLLAAKQVCALLGPKLCSKYNNNVCKDIIIPTFINLVTSIISGFFFFSILGYMEEKSGHKIENVATGEPGLVLHFFIVGFETVPYSMFWKLKFFMMLLTFGLYSSLEGSERIITSLSDLFPKIKKNRKVFVAMLFSLYFVYGLFFCTQSGFYIIQLVDKYAVGCSILLAVLSEAIAVNWIYCARSFSKNWIYCWCYNVLLILLFIIFCWLLNYEPLAHANNNGSLWANVLGWCLSISALIMIPANAIYQMCITKGSFLERLKIIATPVEDQQVSIN